MQETVTTIEIPKGTDYKADSHSNFWSNLKWRSLFCLIESRGHMPISELAIKVGLSSSEALLALESMENLNLIRRTDNGYVQIKNVIKRAPLNPQDTLAIVNDYVLSSDQVANRLLERIHDAARQQTRSVIYNSNQALVRELYTEIDAAIERFKIKSDNSFDSWDGVYAFSAAILNVTGDI